MAKHRANPFQYSKPRKGPSQAGQPIDAWDHQRKPAMVNSRRIGGAQRAAYKRFQKRRDSR